MKTILTTLIILVFFNACRTDRCDNPPCKEIKTIDAEFARFWDFGFGSYWVYVLKSDTTVIDSLILYGNVNKTNGNCPPFDYSGPPCTQFIDIIMKHSNPYFFFDGDEKLIDNFYIKTNGIEKDLLFINYETVSPYRGLEVVNFSFEPYPKTEMQLVDTLPVAINNKNYKNIAHMQTTLDTSIHKSIYTNLWWSKDIGLIKFATSDGNEWELKKFEIK